METGFLLRNTLVLNCVSLYIAKKNVFTWVCYLHESAIILQSLSETDPLV